MRRIWLERARARKHWTLEQAAEALGVDINTVSRWEQGKTTPYAYNVERLCQVYGVTAEDLGLEEKQPSSPAYVADTSASRELHEAEQSRELITQSGEQYPMLRLLTIVLAWPPHNMRYGELQWLILQETEDTTVMTSTNADPMSRRDALRQLALLPINVYGLGAAMQAMKSPIEGILTQCAAGLVACQVLSKGQYEEMAFAHAVVSSYLPTLEAIVKDSSSYRQPAAELAAQALFLKSRLTVHAQGAGAALYYADRAVLYSKESGDLALQVAFLRNASWIYSLNKQTAKALNAILQAQQLMKRPAQSLPPLVQSEAYGGLAKRLALGGRSDEAPVAIQRAYEAFFSSSERDEVPMHVECNRSTLILDEGLMYYHGGKYEKAFEVLAQAIDPETLTSKISASSERIRVEIINYQTLTSLKRQKKDRELSIKLWKAGVQGAKALKSEQRFAEAHTAYEIMEGLWGGEKPLDDLHDELNHW